MSRQGVHRLTAMELGREVGIADGTVFRHFKDKAEIVRAAVEHLEGLLFAGFPPKDEDPVDRLKAFFIHRLTLVQRMPTVFLPIFSDRLEEAAGDDARAVRGMVARSQQFVAACLAEAQERGRVDAALSVDALVLVVVGTLQAAAFRQKGGRRTTAPGPEEVWRVLERLLTAGARRARAD